MTGSTTFVGVEEILMASNNRNETEPGTERRKLTGLRGSRRMATTKRIITFLGTAEIICGSLAMTFLLLCAGVWALEMSGREPSRDLWNMVHTLGGALVSWLVRGNVNNSETKHETRTTRTPDRTPQRNTPSTPPAAPPADSSK